MSNAFSNPTVFAAKTIRQLENNCVMGKLVFRGYEKEWEKEVNGYKVGSSISVDAPKYARVKDGATVDVVDLLSPSTTFSLSYRKHVAFKLSSEEMTYNIDKFDEKIIQPAMVALGNYIDATILGLAKNVANQVGTPNTTPQNFITYALASARLSDHAVPMDNRFCVINPTADAYLRDHMKGLFAPSTVDRVTKAGYMGGQLSGMEMYTSQNVLSFTPGSQAGVTGAQMSATSSEGDNTLALDNLGATNTMLEGDLFTVGSVYAVNPISGQSLGYLRQFTVDADATATAGAIAALTCSPGSAPFPIYSASATETYLPYQTVDALPANNAAITVAGTASTAYTLNLAAHRDAIGLCCVPLEMPPSATWKTRATKNGYSVRVIRYYDGDSDAETIRFDVLFGLKVLNPMMACRIAG